MVKFSDTYSRDIPDELASKLWKQVRQYKLGVFGQNPQIVITPDEKLGILAKIKVDTGSDSELLNNEPIIIEFSSVDDIEACDISVYPDRKDFPFEIFPHINYAARNMPPSLCLTRENFADWYSEHTFPELINNIARWFDDAKSGNLIKLKDGDYFEPFRLHGEYDILFKVPIEDSYIEKFRYAGTIVTPIYIADDKLHVYSTSQTKTDKNGACAKILFYRSSKIISKKWFCNYPQNYGELINFLRENGFVFNIEDILKEQSTKEQNINIKDLRKLFFQISFVRPVKVLGKKSRVDYLYFSVDLNDLKQYCDNATIREVMCLDYTTTEFARYMSGTSMKIESKKILVLGCGAIGSKLTYHLYRSGICNITVCDKDIMEPHNVCRHALSHSGLFTHKVDMIKKELDRMFFYSSSHIAVIKENINTWLPNQDLKEYDLIIDATASASVFHTLNSQSVTTVCPIVHFALSEAGKVGLVYVNYNRDCMLSDYYMQLLTFALHGDDDLCDWLTTEQTYTFENVRVGEGCHSNTMILSDDIISTHTGIASSIIRNIFDISHKKNEAYLSFVNKEYIGQVFTEHYEMDKIHCLRCENMKDWSVRLTSKLLFQIRHRAKVAGRNETGGYLLGTIDEKHKCIYIVNQFDPNDSVGGNRELRLGINGWKEFYEESKVKVANAITYIGDWHSHPKGSLNQSDIDINTCNDILAHEIKTHIGICVITNNNSTKAYILTPM